MKLKRALCIILAVVALVGLLPTAALAADESAADGSVAVLNNDSSDAKGYTLYGTPYIYGPANVKNIVYNSSDISQATIDMSKGTAATGFYIGNYDGWVTWSSTNTSIATVSKYNGEMKIWARDYGSCYINAVLENGKTVRLKVTVTKRLVFKTVSSSRTSVTFDVNNNYWSTATKLYVKGSALNSKGKTITSKTFCWSKHVPAFSNNTRLIISFTGSSVSKVTYKFTKAVFYNGTTWAG